VAPPRVNQTISNTMVFTPLAFLNFFPCFTIDNMGEGGYRVAIEIINIFGKA